MALNKTITVSSQFQNNSTSPTGLSFTAEAVMVDGVLVPDIRTTNPGVYTAGTSREGTSVNNTSI